MKRPLRCFGCHEYKRPERHYLCSECWFSLPEHTRKRLWLHDAQARHRLFQLYSAIRRDVPLDQIEVSA